MREQRDDGSEREQNTWEAGTFKVIISRVRNHPELGSKVVSIDIGSKDKGSNATHYDVHIKDLEQLEAFLDAMIQAEVKWRKWIAEDANWSIEE